MNVHMQTLGTDELHFLKLYTNVVNPIRPFLTSEMIRQGVFYHAYPQRVLPLGDITYARIASIWGAIAYGASLARDRRADVYADCARAALQHCFDQPSPDIVRTYLLMESLSIVTTRAYSMICAR